MGKEGMMLYWGSGSPFCWKVQMVLEEKGFGDIQQTLINFSKGEHKCAEVMALNPRGQVPTFKDGDIVVNESMAICLYLERAYPDSGTQLIPSKKEDFAKVYQTAIEAQENLQMKIAYKCLSYYWRTPKEKQDDETINRSIIDVKEELSIWEERLKKSGGEFICGEHFTLADVTLFIYVAIVVRAGGTLIGYPALKGYYDRLSKRKSIIKSWPPHWHEGPLEDEKQIFKQYGM